MKRGKKNMAKKINKKYILGNISEFHKPEDWWNMIELCIRYKDFKTLKKILGRLQNEKIEVKVGVFKKLSTRNRVFLFRKIDVNLAVEILKKMDMMDVIQILQMMGDVDKAAKICKTMLPGNRRRIVDTMKERNKSRAAEICQIMGSIP